MVDGDEFCLRLCETGGRVNVDSVLADSFFATPVTSRVGILKKSLEDEAMYADKRRTSQLIGVFD